MWWTGEINRFHLTRCTCLCRPFGSAHQVHLRSLQAKKGQPHILAPLVFADTQPIQKNKRAKTSIPFFRNNLNKFVYI
jgi:hypothetical protein